MASLILVFVFIPALCVGRNTCRLTYTDSEKFEPELMDQLEAMGWGDLKESIAIHRL